MNTNEEILAWLRREEADCSRIINEWEKRDPSSESEILSGFRAGHALYGSAANALEAATKIKAERDRLAALVERLKMFVDEIRGIANNSNGVVGWHLNGQILNWSQVDCMRDVDELLALTPDTVLKQYRSKILESVAKHYESEDCLALAAEIRAMKDGTI